MIHRTAAWLTILCGVLAAIVIRESPQTLLAPAWIGYAACAACVLAGAAVLAKEAGASTGYRWAVSVLLVAMVVAAAWATLSSVAWPELGPVDTVAVRRVALAIGAAIVAITLVWAFRTAVCPTDDAGRGMPPKR